MSKQEAFLVFLIVVGALAVVWGIEILRRRARERAIERAYREARRRSEAIVRENERIAKARAARIEAAKFDYRQPSRAAAPTTNPIKPKRPEPEPSRSTDDGTSFIIPAMIFAQSSPARSEPSHDHSSHDSSHSCGSSQ